MPIRFTHREDELNEALICTVGSLRQAQGHAKRINDILGISSMRVVHEGKYDLRLSESEAESISEYLYGVELLLRCMQLAQLKDPTTMINRLFLGADND
jgi:hypothetical protein